MAKIPQGIKKKKDGRYEKRITIDGKRISICGRSLKEIAEKERKKLIQIESGEEERENPTLDQYHEMFIDDRRGKVKESTLRSQAYQYRICSGVQIVNSKRLGAMRMKDIEKKDIKKLQRQLSKSSKLSNGSVNHYIDHLRHIFNKAVNDEYIEKNPCNGLEKLPEESNATKTIHRCLSKDETSKFFKEAEGNYYYNFFGVLIQTGLRIGELCALRYSDVDFKNEIIRVNKTITRDEVGGYLVGESAKTKKGNREIPMSKMVAGLIADQQKKNRVYFDIQPFDDLIFKAPSGEILREYQINREIQRICKRADIEYFTCHCFRHTMASRFIEERPHDYKILSEILGHSSTKITLDLYTHTMMETKVKSMKEFEIAL